MRRWSIGLVLLLALVVPARPAGPSIDGFFATFTDEWMRHLKNAGARYFTGAEQDALERQIPVPNEARRKRSEELLRDGLRRVRAFDLKTLTPEQRLASEVLTWDLDRQLQGAAFRDYSFPLVQTYGTGLSLVSLMTVDHPMATARDAENYAERLRYVAPVLEQAIQEADRLLKKRMGPPKFILEASLAQMKAFLVEPGKNPLVTTFAEKSKTIAALDAGKRAALLADVEQVTANAVYPTWRKGAALLEAAIPLANNDAGLWRLKGGDKAYAYALRSYTTTRMTAEEIHATGLRMVAELDAKMDAVLRQAGFSEGTIQQRIGQFWERQGRYTGPNAMAEQQADIDKQIREAAERAKTMFDRVPKLPVVAQPYPAFIGQRSASYRTPPVDGSRPGVFQYTASASGQKGRKTTVYHETIPGHHFQLSLRVENTKLVKFRQAGIFGGNSASTEGWGLYAERLVAEAGWYEGDLAGQLDQLEAERFRAQRLVVDTGLHAKRWTRQQAVEYLGGREDEVDRYVVQPGQACSYMIGELKLLDLRERARQTLGAKFSLKQFHNVVLETGIVPLDVLDRVVNEWIQTQL
jgi:uncharacterized protein (DUF885 family)